MKCLNPECPDPSFVESLPVEGIKFCPICASPLKPAPKSSDNKKSEKLSQTEEERRDQSSFKPNKNETTELDTSSSPLSEPNGSGEELVGSSSATSDIGNQDQEDLPDDNKPKPPDNGSNDKDNESQQARVVEDEVKLDISKEGKNAKEDEGPEKGKDVKEGKGLKTGEDTKEEKDVIEDKEPEKGKDTKEDKGPAEKGKDTKGHKGPEKGKDTKESKDTEKGKDTKEGKGPEKGKDTKEGKGPGKGKDTKEGKGPEKGKDTKKGKGPEKGKDTKEGKGPEKGKDTKEDKNAKGSKGPEKAKDDKDSKESTGEGRSSSDDNYMTIVLHALLAPHFQFDPKQDSVVVRGGYPHFSGWQKDHLVMSPIRQLPGGYIVIEGSTTILLKNACKKLNYKYLVLKKDENKEMWEELIDSHASNKARVNRCVYIPEQYRKAKGVWHQYDDAVFSQPKFWESIRNKIPYLEVMNPYEGRELAIQAVLPDWDSFGLDETSGKRKGKEILATINQVVHCMENLEAELHGSTVSRYLEGFSLERVLVSYIDPRLKTNYELAQSTNNENIQANRLATSLAIAAVVSNFVRKFSFQPLEGHLKVMFECLALNASLGRQKIERIMEILAQHYPKKSWMKFSGAISELCQYAINHYPDVHQWLLAVPLMHFMGEESRPYTDSPPLLSEPTPRDVSYWGTNGLDVTQIQSSPWRSPVGFLHRLKPMFEIDPLLRRTFLFTLPLSNLGRCVAQGSFLPHEVIWTLAYVLRNINYYNPDELTSINTCLDFMINMLDSENKGSTHASESVYVHQDELTSLAKGSLLVLEYLLMPSSLKDVFNLACSVLRLLSKCLCLVIKSAGPTMSGSSTDENTPADQTEDSNNTFCANILKEATEKVRNRLCKLFSSNLMLTYDYYKDEELKIWSAFLQVEFSDDTLQTSWRTKLLEGLTARADKMSDNEKIKFYSTVNLNHLHEEVEKCFQKAAFDAITRIIEDGRAVEHAEAFDSLSMHDPNSSQSRRIGDMMSLLLKRCWPEDTDQQGNLLTHVLTWSPMANYLKFFSESSQTLREDSQILLIRTRSCLEDIHRMVSDASVTVNILHILRGKEAKYCELIDVMGYSIDDSDDDSDEESEEDETDDEQDDAHKGSGSMYKKAKVTLQKRLDELAAFEEEREQLRSFLGIGSILQHVDVDKMKATANANVSQKAISDLAVHISGERDGHIQVQVTFFGLSKELKTMITTMHRIHGSKIFIDIWRKKFRNAQHDEQTMTLEEAVQRVWFPTFKKCKDILQAVLTGDITLGDIDERFQDYEGRYNDLEQDLGIIVGALGYTVDVERIRTQVDQIQQYHRLTNCIAAAEKILEFADNMDLDGDFKMVDTFRLQISQDSKKQPLKSLREEFSQTGSILEEFTAERLKCLDAVMESKDFIDWLNDNVPDPSEIKVLVDLAMMSAGEGDMESDRIAALHTCTRGFKPLIYDLNEDAGFDRLVGLCQEVWDDLEHNPRLPEQMTDTSRRLEWLKNVLEFHGSVTMSSLQQVETIIKHGTLTIGCHGNSEEINIDTVISLRVPEDKTKGLQKETYSLEDLKDLQSKLMLIAGKSAGQEHVDKFTEMLQGAISLGTVYITLYETGEVSHLYWKKEFECRWKNVLKDLQDDYDEFDELLKTWTEILNYQRIKCKELNYFTAKQLLYMRKEIAELRRGRDFASLDVQLYTLLDSVLPGVNARSLQEALIAIGIDVDFPEENQPPLETVEEKIPDGDLRKRYEKFFNNAKEVGFSEEVTLAAIVACDCPSDEYDLLMWAVQHKEDEDVIQEMCDEGAQNPKYASLFPQESVPDETPDEEEEDMDIGRPLPEDGDRNIAAELDQTLDGLYLSLEELSTLLGCLADDPNQEDQGTMTFPEYLMKGKLNLLLVPQRDILPTVLGLYMDSEGLPSRHEVLICTHDTTLEEVELLWRRVLTNSSDKFYCLVNADLLSYDVSQQAVQNFYQLANREYPASDDYQVVVICSNEQEVKSHIVSALDECRVAGAPRCPRPSEVTEYLQKKFVAPKPQTVVYQGHHVDWIPAAEVESQNRLSVRVISSDRAGTGKSLIVQDYSKRLVRITNNSAVTQLLEEQEEHVTPYVIVPLHGKTANLSDTVGFLLPYSLKTDVPMSRIFHIDVSPSVEHGLDTLLFNLLLLGSIQDNRGRVWKRNPRDLYIVEVTSSHDTPQTGGTDKYARLHNFYHELPRVTCVTPTKALQEMSKDTAPGSCMASFNEGQFQSEPVQRVYQYLQLYDTAPEILHEFQFDPQVLAEGAAKCLCLLMTYCGVNDPSWAELRHFVDFLNYQLTDCERSVFCQMENVADTLEGFRLFVVRFMTLMAQDFSTRSLSDRIEDANTQTDEMEDIVQFQLRRRWESSPHPYMFFNPDHQTFTFLGFRLDPDGNLINSSTGEMIQEHLMTRHLRTGLHVQKVNFDENFEHLNKGEKIQKICAVLGVEWPRDPDESYELTEDNAKKMLAIHMRFRCGIPVVVMGETGCGKTKLIRYLCGLQKGFEECKNMLLVKVHGGTSFQDIERKVKQARQMAKENSKNNVETILFFDEVNTTEALDLVKEIMVDRRLNGRPLGSEDDGLRFIAACNPYRKHTDTMIKKLESAGLGYSVKTGDITERIGCVPLRHLVYRVHALPDSMRSLIWDFGQLKPQVELLYTRQIVLRHVITENRIPGDESLVDAITAVLAASQQYMRDQSDECSFVSLRDVERTMNVMVWFYEHKEVFRLFLENIAKEEDNGTDERRTDDEEEEENSGVDGGDGDDEDESDSDSDGRVKKVESDDEEKTDIRKYKKQWPGFMFAALRRASKKQEAAESNPIPSGSGISMPAASFPFEFPPAFSAFEDKGPFVPIDDEDLDTRDEIQERMPIFEEEDLDDPTKPLDPVTWSLILAIGVCYHARLQDREQYRQDIAKTFRRPCVLYGGADRILQEITACEKAVLEELDPGPNIARNTALSENVFMMVVCIELRIPLFVIGKPGSSKSLAKTVVHDNMQGDASKSQLFKSFKEVQMSSHQCSPLSTPEGIQDTFRQCANIQKDKNPDKFVSVVVLDEVGLAEDSPLMPLKTLHPLLEDGVTSSDDIIETDEKPTRVAFIGISNWALDPAKMNRGIMLSRDVPDKGELEDSAMGICASNEEVQELMVPIIPALASAYSELYEQQKDIEVLTKANKDEFFGLRDFYSLIKMLRVIAEERKRVPDWRDVEYAVRRNFGGLDVEELNPVDIFMEHLDVDDHVRREDQRQARDVSPIKLIKSSLEKDASEKNSRYLLILTENHAALGIVEQHLNQLKEQETDDLDAVLIFGSSFPKDLEYTQVCRNINDIKVCMETGRTVILLNMESLYEGLYDALNQYYVEFAGNRYVDLGLGTHRVKCRVHENFRLIVIAEKDTVYKKFPIPLINRLEKHFLVLSTSLTKPQEKLVTTLKGWVQRFSTIELPGYRRSKKKFTEDDAFVGYHDDTIPSVVLQVCSQLQQDGTTVDDEEKDQWENEVLWECKRRLVQCCPPDAIVRLHYSKLQYEADQLWGLYFKQQQHSSLASFVSNVDRRHHQDGLLIQVSTHSKLLSEQNLKEVGKALHLHHSAISCITLQQFPTEQQFCDSVGTFFAKQGGQECLLIVQCNTEDLTFNLLACARHHLLKQRSKITEEIPEDAQPTHIIVIIQLPKMFGRYPNFVGFQGQRWESVHIDELFTPSFYVPSLEKVKDHSLSDLFKESIDMCFSKTDKEEQVLDAVDVVRQSVQAAAGRIEDGQETVARATKRIVILLSLLSKDRGEELDENFFSHILLRRVHHLLKEKDASAPKEGVEWSTSEALESSELQESGTYRKALWRRIQNAVVPILSEVIAYMDKDGNLELLHTDVPWIKELWLKIFADDILTQLNYESFLTNDDERRLKSHVRVTSSGRDSHWFQCQLPFSWLLKENIDSMWLQAKNVSENSDESIQDCFQSFVARSDIADEINVIEEEQEAMERYIHDFVHMNCKPVEKGEDKLIVRALIVEARHQHALSASHEDDFEFPDIALVHKAYSHIEHRIACFSHLVQCIPSIVPKVLDFFTPDENEMILDVMALQMCLESLEPLERSFKDNVEKRQWCDEVIAVRATAERIFADKCQLEDEEKRMGIIKCCRPLWERLTAIRLFIEHVYLTKKKSKRSDSENIIKLCKVLDEKTDFSSASSIEAVELFLVECIEGFKKSSSQTVIDFRYHCNSFFMELISLLCFGGDGHRKSLEPEVFEIFMRYITGSSSPQATKNFSPFPDFEVDKTPVVRSFLLQQLLTNSFGEVRIYLQRYLSDAQALFPDRHHVMRVCQLVVDCIEDCTSSTLSQRELPTPIFIGLVTSRITKGSVALQKARHSDMLNIEALDAIAQVRYFLSLTAELLFKSCVAGDTKLQEPDVKSELDKLLNVVQVMCEDMPDRAPLVYLLKQLTRRYGASAIKDLTQDPEMIWLIPREFQERQIDASSDADRFVVYNEEYTNVRDALAKGLLSGSVDEISLLTQVDGSDMTNSKTRMDVLCLLSIYREVTCGYREPRHQLQEYEELRKFFNDNLSPEARPLAVQLLDNSHGMGFTALSVQPAQPRDTVNLAELVVHTMVVLQCSNDNEFVRTLRALLMDPGSMKDSFLPTMPEDDFHQVRMGLTEPNKWYECPKGHRYSIGDCGGATQASVCPECKSGIGGTAYNLLPGNALLTEPNEDRSNRGHILGNANMNQASSAMQPERNLSPAVVHLIRLVMHSAMLVGACRHPQESSQIFSPPVEPGRLNQFLWAHLTRDLRCLAAALNRNEDEALLTVHLVLAQITRVQMQGLHDDAVFRFPGTGVLNSSGDRRQWEEDFTSRFIDPVLSRLDEHLQTCFNIMTSDSRVGTDPLMREIYEVDTLDTEQEEEDEEEALNPMKKCFWRYRPSITVEHAKQRFSEEMKSDKKSQCKVLQNFFKEDYRLRVVRYLPNINKLHKLLTDRLYQRINPKQASEMKVKEFEAKLKASEKKEFKALFGSFNAAWALAREHLDKLGRYKLSSEERSMTIDDNSPLSILIPSSDGLGRCSLALVFYLVTAHNEFMETYFNIIMGKARQDNKIRLSEVTSSQLVSYDTDRHLLPLIQAHCHYSLEVGHGTSVEYDWPAIQRQLIDRFIRGKVLVEFEEPKFVFLRNNDEDMFNDVRSKIEQENISPASTRMITAELRHLNEVCEVKLSLEIAMGFLSSGGQPEQLISEYLHDVLRMPKEKGLKSRRAEQYCQLKHIIHLWHLVTTQRAKILLKDEQDPFDEVEECFKEDIPRPILLRLNKSLSTIDCRRFCLELLEMIMFSLNEENEKHVDISLQEFFEWHMDDREATDVSDLPEKLLLKHAVKTWENVLEKSEQSRPSRH